MQHRYTRNPTFCGDFFDWEGGMTQADPRPRIHLRRDGPRWTYAFSPTSAEQGGGPTPGEQLDRALANLGDRARGGVVVIVEGAL